jgi:osmotically-inducible protein OsmY
MQLELAMARDAMSSRERWGRSARRGGRAARDATAHRFGRGLLLALLAALPIAGCSRTPAPVSSWSAAQISGKPEPRKAPSARRDDVPARLTLASDRRIPDAWIVTGVRRELEPLAGVAQHRLDVASEGGIVTLAGTVSTPLARSLVVERSLAVDGVRAIVNRLEIAADESSDLEISAQVGRRLRYDPVTEHQPLRIEVNEGVVRLEGSLRTLAERKIAERAAQSVPGVRAVDNHIVLTAVTSEPDDRIAEEIARRLTQDRALYQSQVAVRASGGSVFLTGEVKSAFERRALREFAWLPGVHAVYDDGVRVVPTREHLRDPALPAPDDAAVTRAVMDSLRIDPRLLGSSVEISTVGGTVTLEGVVADPLSRSAAEQNALSTFGARAVQNNIQVEPADPVPDAVIERRVGERLGGHPGITKDGIRVFVEDGWVLLSGNADSAYERNRAEGTTSRVKGVMGVVNRLQIQPDSELVRRDDLTVRAEIRQRLARDPRVGPDLVEVDVKDGIATLRGRVHDYGVFDAVLEDVFSALPRGVDNRLEVTTPPARREPE